MQVHLATAASGETAQTTDSNAVPVYVGILLDQIVGIDQKAENFSAVYTLQLRYTDPALAYEPALGDPPFRMTTVEDLVKQIQAVNSLWPAFVLSNKQGRRDVNIETVQVHPDGEVRYYERATATFQAPDFDFRRFPLDTQIFHIRLEMVPPDSFFVFEELPGYTIVGDALGEEEWVVFDSFTEVDKVTAPDGSDHSRFSFSFQAHRHILYYVVRIFTPMIIILLVSWFTFRLRDYVKRIDIGITVLLLFIAFNFTLGGDLPRLGYLTFVDALIAGTFVITGAVILVNVQLRIWERHGQEERAKRFDRLAMVGYWPAYLVGMSAALFFI